MAKQRKNQPASHAPSDEDAQAFRAAMRGVKPLAHTPPPAGLAGPRRPARRRSAAVAEDREETMPLIATSASHGHGDHTGDQAPAGATGSATLSFRRSGVRTQVVRRLRRGLIPIDAELDLHGLTQTAARDRLAQFLCESRDSGRRCVRIIHGKGFGSGARGPVLKTAVDLWLRRHLDVMAFTSARPVDGGTGALYVLLRA